MAYPTSKRSIAIKNFSPVWFLISMDTGILSIIMQLLPWQFNGLKVLSTIMFVWNLVLFSFFAIISLFRLFKYPSHAKKQILSSADELSYLAAPAIAYLTLVVQVSLICSTAWGYRFTVLAYVLWWIGLVWTVTLCSGNVILLSKRNLYNQGKLSPPIFLPLISVMTLATTGGIVAYYSTGITASMAVPVIIVAFICVGYSLFLSLLYYSAFIHHLFVIGLPPPAKIPALIITVGPLGQCATAVQVLGSAVSTGKLFAGYNEGNFITATAAPTISAVCELLALLIVGFAFLWIAVGWYLVVEGLARNKIPFSMSWWSMIFPMGVFTTALVNLSIAMDSPGFRGLSAALLIFLLLIYFYNWVFTLYQVYTGEFLGIPQDRHEEERRRHEQQDRNDQSDKDEFSRKENNGRV